MKHNIKPFDKVLVRDCDTEEWLPKLYFRFWEGKHQVATGSFWRECIPFEGNEHLCGTTDSPEEPLKKGDIVAVWDNCNPTTKRVRVYSHRDSHGGHYVFTSTNTLDHWEHAERFTPASVEDASAT